MRKGTFIRTPNDKRCLIVIERIEAIKKLHKILFSVATAVLISTGPAFADGDAKIGKKVFIKCRACHALKVGKKKVGTSRHGIVGRKAGSESYFKCSKAMKASGIEWTTDNLHKYIRAPKKFISKNKMPFGGLKKAKGRANIIAYLKFVSNQPYCENRAFRQNDSEGSNYWR